MVPSFSAPIVTLILIACLVLVASKFSFLSYIILDGFPVFKVTRAVYISTTEVCLPPKPPPTLGLIILILLGDISNALANCLFMWKGT
ncbi:hypothetical protein D3C81_817810 [compost metagenome]